jgi:hypothetical protein
LTAGAAGAGAATPPACLTAHLAVSVRGGSGAAGTIYYKLRFTNRGATSCTLRGYPGVSAVSRGGAQLGVPATRGSLAGLRTVTVARGRAVSAQLAVHDAGAFDPCRLVHAYGLRVYPPNQRASVTVRFAFDTCTNASAQVLAVGAVG